MMTEALWMSDECKKGWHGASCYETAIDCACPCHGYYCRQCGRFTHKIKVVDNGQRFHAKRCHRRWLRGVFVKVQATCIECGWQSGVYKTGMTYKGAVREGEAHHNATKHKVSVPKFARGQQRMIG